MTRYTEYDLNALRHAREIREQKEKEYERYPAYLPSDKNDLTPRVTARDRQLNAERVGQIKRQR